MAFAESAERSGRQQSQATGFQAKKRAPRLITKYTKMNSMAAFSPFIQHSVAGVCWARNREYNSTRTRHGFNNFFKLVFIAIVSG